MIFFEGGPGDGGPGDGGPGDSGIGGGGSGSITPPSPVRGGRGVTLLQRDPTVDRREGRNWEILTEMINSLLVQGFIFKEAGAWNIQIVGSTAGLTGTFDSGAF